MTKRRLAREVCLQVLYLNNTGSLTYRQILSYFDIIKTQLDKKTLTFAESLLDGTLKHIEKINAVISEHAKNWKIERMSGVDKCIMQIAAFEILHMQETPAAVIINEAIELAKKYSTDKSSKFINGILDKIKINSSGRK